VVSAAAQPRGPAIDMPGLLARVGRQMEHYFSRAENVICKETVRVQRLGADLLGDGSFARQIVSELRLDWRPASDGVERAEVAVLREIVTINGRPPRARDDQKCMDPRAISTDPLEMLLPDRQSKYAFTWGGLDRVDGRAAAMLDYRSVEIGPPVVTRRDDCVSFDLPGRSRGRLWIDQETGEVLRLDERLIGPVDINVPPDPHRRSWTVGTPSLIVERIDASTRFKRVAFENPEETLMLPASVETFSVVRNSGSPRVRISQVFSDHRRFVTEGRIIQP
jgi:hypothetical protein